jgi:hypothetical protein
MKNLAVTLMMLGGKSDKPLPVIVFIHGGAWQGGNKGSGRGSVMPYVTSGEYAGASVEYRLSGEAKWPAQIEDCKAAIRWIKAHAKENGLDPEKIAVWGTSAGGPRGNPGLFFNSWRNIHIPAVGALNCWEHGPLPATSQACAAATDMQTSETIQ